MKFEFTQAQAAALLDESYTFRSIVAGVIASNRIYDDIKEICLLSTNKICAIKKVREEFKDEKKPSLEQLKGAFPDIDFSYPHNDRLGLVDTKNMVEVFLGR